MVGAVPVPAVPEHEVVPVTWQPVDTGPASVRPLWQSYAILEPSVVVPADVARWLAQRIDLSRLRDEARTADPAVHAVLVALRAAELTPVERQVADEVAPRCEPPDLYLRCPTVARMAGVSDAAVRRAAAEGRLPGHRAATGWEFRPEDVQRWIRRRQAA